MNMTRLKHLLESPPAEFRGKPFWAWNGKLDPDELRRQVRVMHRMGLGGFFMHSRVGLDTAYLSEEWFRCVDACIDEASKLDMEAWLYDEDRWPSGAAGGLVTKKSEYRMRDLRCETVANADGLKWTDDVIAVFTANVQGHVALNVRQMSQGERPCLEADVSLLVFREHVQEPSSWYNGGSYLDTMNPDAVREFIRVTHEAYKAHCDQHFGNRVPGIFTDEPNYGAGWRGYLPWTPRLPEVFRERYGYDIRQRLPELFFDVDGVTIFAARRDFLDCANFLFVDAFSRQLGEWCEANGLAHTGHVLHEERLATQAGSVGSCMRFYEYMQLPGMDLLTERNREYDTAKQVASVANQFGRKWRLTETYGCTGWDFPFMGHKALGDWQAALGINLRCQHLSWYTMQGAAKRDYPAGIFYQSPWWDLYGKVEDYFARLHVVMTRGREVRNVLVLDPLESAWAVYRPGPVVPKRLRRLDNMRRALRDSLLMANLDFDYGDEDIMARHGRVSRRGGSPRLCVGKAFYTTVVVPPLLTMRRSTLTLLKRFRKAGGTVVFAGAPAARVDMELSDAVKAFAGECVLAPEKGEGLSDAVAETGRTVSIADGQGRELPGTLYLLREDADAQYLFVCNTGNTAELIRSGKAEPRARDRNVVYPDVRISGFEGLAGAPLEIDLESGDVRAAHAARTANGWTIATQLPALGSRVFMVPRVKSRAGKAIPPLRVLRSRALKPGTWDVSLSEENVLVLDRAEYRIGNGRRKELCEVLQIDHAVRESLGIERRGGEMVQPWARKSPQKPKRTIVELIYRFEVKALPKGALHLAVECPRTFSISLNGHTVNQEAECGWWCDLSLRRLPLDTACLQIGVNEIRMVCNYDETHPGLEMAYLLGTFGVSVKGTDITMVEAPCSLKIGDWVNQGLPFYSGHVAYRQTIRQALGKGERLFVRVPAYRGVGVRVLVDGVTAGIVAWEPNEVEITHLLKEGRGELAIEVLGHRRNSHGPLHHKEKWPAWTGPAQFEMWNWWTDGYRLVPCGLMKAPMLVIKR
jgi:hypothetical protein